MATSRFTTADRGRQMASPRPKTRDTKDTLCRNVLIYGHCRYEDQGCAFNHDQNKGPSNSIDSAKKSLNVDSPSFTPTQLQQSGKKHTFSSQTANAAVFTPKAVATTPTPVLPPDAESPFVNPAAVREFTPQSSNYDLNTTPSTNGIAADSSGNMYDAFTMASLNQTLPTSQYNPYADDHASMAGAGASFFQAQGAYSAAMQPLQYHLYAPAGPHRSDVAPYQRQAHEFFLPNDIREDLQKKAAATRQVLPNSQLPDVSHYHSLVPLDAGPKSSHSMFGNTVCWVYKATSKKNGNVYCLRRLQGARVNSKETTNGPLSKWKRINNGSIVSVIEVFTSRDFNDTSLIFIHNYHPNAKTLAELHQLGNHNRFGRPQQIQENVIWGYISQLCNALRTIHAEGLAARCIHPSKVILTEKNRIRLGACMILDVLAFDSSPPVAELQQQDLVDLGKLILSLATNTLNVNNLQQASDQFARTNYTKELKELTYWLLSPPYPEQQIPKSVFELSRHISEHLFNSFDASLHAYDDMNSNLYQELENGRLVRLLLKLGTINERPEFDNDPNWAENGERYPLKLFRDYVFHQVDSNGNPVLELGHMLSCLNKLDAGIDEKVYLTSRDHQTSFVVSYKELKKQAGNAFQELVKATNQTKHSTQRPGF